MKARFQDSYKRVMEDYPNIFDDALLKLWKELNKGVSIHSVEAWLNEQIRYKLLDATKKKGLPISTIDQEFLKNSTQQEKEIDSKLQITLRLPLLLYLERYYHIVCWRTETPQVEWKEIAARLNREEGALRGTWTRDIWYQN
ncbi:MAG: hypothetical protein HC912_02690 [Saprospiraceae bacterium]|nr:hypothetical protein [Saprospiraceae bacterium]